MRGSSIGEYLRFLVQRWRRDTATNPNRKGHVSLGAGSSFLAVANDDKQFAKTEL